MTVQNGRSGLTVQREPLGYRINGLFEGRVYLSISAALSAVWQYLEVTRMAWAYYVCLVEEDQ